MPQRQRQRRRRRRLACHVSQQIKEWTRAWQEETVFVVAQKMEDGLILSEDKFDNFGN